MSLTSDPRFKGSSPTGKTILLGFDKEGSHLSAFRTMDAHTSPCSVLPMPANDGSLSSTGWPWVQGSYLVGGAKTAAGLDHPRSTSIDGPKLKTIAKPTL